MSDTSPPAASSVDPAADWRQALIDAAASDAGILPGAVAGVAPTSGAGAPATRVILEALEVWDIVSPAGDGRYERGPGGRPTTRVSACCSGWVGMSLIGGHSGPTGDTWCEIRHQVSPVRLRPLVAPDGALALATFLAARPAPGSGFTADVVAVDERDRSVNIARPA